jgi:phage terminase small subunit
MNHRKAHELFDNTADHRTSHPTETPDQPGDAAGPTVLPDTPFQPGDGVRTGQKPVSRAHARRERLIEALADPSCPSVSEAARRAGFAESTATSKIYAMIKEPGIQTAVQERIQRNLAHHHVTPEEVLGHAVRQMRSSMDDVLDKDGEWSIERARETGAIDQLKKHKTTTRSIFNKRGELVETIKTVEVEMMSNEDGRAAVANYMGIQNFENKAPTDAELFVTVFHRLMARGELTREEIIFGLKRQPMFRELDEEALLAE